MKKIVIMGASSGIGYGVADALASRGVRVGLAARKTEKLKALADKYPGMVVYESIDVTKPDAVEKINKLADKLGGMDIYFHVSGVGYENEELEPELEAKVAETNVVGFMRCISAAYRYFKQHGIKGQIAAVSSVAGTKGIGRMAAYSASKAADSTYLAALEQLSNATDSGISFTDIRPGWVKTPLILADVKYPMEMTVEEVVPQVIKAIVRKKRVAVIDWRWNIAVGLWRLLPNCLWTRMDMQVALPENK